VLAFVDIRDFKPASWRANIGLVPQDPVLFTGTIAENISYDRPDASQAEIEEAARIANCEFIWDMPLKFETKSECGSGMTYGESSNGCSFNSNQSIETASVEAKDNA